MVVSEERFTFEMTQEVEEKIRNAEKLHIREEDVADLEYVEVHSLGYRIVKRTCDILLSLFGLLVLCIPMLLICAAIYIDDRGNAIFRQYRVGRNGTRFRLYKFRTMKVSTPKYLSTSEVEDPKQYITKLGKFLRKTSLDEIPQLINVLKGDMSLVGPRPLISDEYEIHQMRMRFGVYNVRPGLTGLAQINGRDTVTPADKVRWDVKYVEKFGFKMDMKILLTTVPNVITRRGVVEGCKKAPEQAAAEAEVAAQK